MQNFGPPIEQILMPQQELKAVPKFDFEVVTVFSREGPTKVYVQHRLEERAFEVNRLLEKDASVYVCGDAANMAIAVKQTLVQVVSEQRRVPKATAENIFKAMKTSRRYQVCIRVLCVLKHHRLINIAGRCMVTS